MYEHKVIIPRNTVVLVIDGEIQFTSLQEGEELVDLDNFNDFIEPFHNGTEWVEGASQEVLDEIEAERNKPLPLSETQKLWDTVNYLINSSYGI